MVTAFDTSKVTAPDINIGIEPQQREKIALGLSQFLADSYTLYLKTHNFHWNVTGPMFRALHNMFEEQYQDLALAVDDIAERIRTLGCPAPGTYAEFARLSSIPEPEGVLAAQEMVRQLAEDHETVVRTARSLVPTVEEVKDEASLDLIVERMQVHEKTAWMLRSIIR
jgi:starvation-inducible DNA-binding protein